MILLDRGAGGEAYDEELVALLLVLLGHGVGDGLSEEADDGEEAEAGDEANDDTVGDTGVGAWGVDGTGAVRAESNPVS